MATETQIRPGRPGDVPALLEAYLWLFSHPGAPPPRWDQEWAARALVDLQGSEHAEVLVAEADGQVVGFCTAYLDIRSVRFGQRSWVEDLAVHPDRRSAGIGRQLLGAAMAWAREHGASHLELDSTTNRAAAHRFYEREQPSWTSMCFGWDLS